jgi:hypothetical protein
MTSTDIVGRGPAGRHCYRRLARGVAAVLSLSVVLVACAGSPSLASSARASGSTVTVTGPVPIGSPTFDNTLYGTSFDLSKVGYEKSQYFISGTAHSYVPAQPLGTDGKWKVST